MNDYLRSALLIGLLGLSACQKKDQTGFDASQLSIQVSNPIETQVFHKGDTVFINAIARYNTELHGYALSIIDKNSLEAYFSIEAHVHDASFDIKHFWVDTLGNNAELQVNLTVEADHEGHQGTQLVNISSKP